jgi:hypothetical protein
MMSKEMDALEAFDSVTNLQSLVDKIVSHIDLKGIRTVYREMNNPNPVKASPSPSPGPLQTFYASQESKLFVQAP